MRPQSGTPVYRPDLGTYMIETGQIPQSGFIGLEVLPPYTTPDDTGTFKVIPLEQYRKMVSDARAPSGAYNRTDWNYQRARFSTRDKGIEEPIDDDEFDRLERQSPGMADQVTIDSARGVIQMNQEKRIANKVMDPSRFTVKNVSNPWNDVANGKPIADVKDGMSEFRKKMGALPDTLILSWNMANAVNKTEEVRNTLQFTFPGLDINSLTAVQLARMFGIARVLIGNAMFDAADKNQPRELTDFWPDTHAALVKTNRGPDLRQPCVGRTFIWTADSRTDPIVEVYREEQIRSDVYRVRHHVDERLLVTEDEDGNTLTDIAANCVYLFGSIKT
ncbi:hypothetical protein HNR65_002160 [Desulfosalsimonas propionicica]|uniref:Major capsid protein E n=1 Tax=Desulfosalsimonas propionicica TaxID=332175 RepID=A0A7W0CA21_9BACT|nr:hypothetical protein [Desulfosalsimonas propionicica]MBA2881829.1 hypothetical protein [Desulfosalsimonas propionicica]